MQDPPINLSLANVYGLYSGTKAIGGSRIIQGAVYVIEVLGMYRLSNTTKGDPNAYRVCWRFLPAHGKPWEVRHMFLHQFSLADLDKGNLQKLDDLDE